MTSGKYIRTKDMKIKRSYIMKDKFKKGILKIPSYKGCVSTKRNKSWEDFYGSDKAQLIKEKQRLKKLGKKQSLETINKRSQNMKGKNKGNIAFKICYQRILEETKELEKQGFRCIPIGKVIPDIIAIKDNKIFAIEVEYQRPNYNKYTDDVRKYFDDIIWLIRNRKYIFNKKTGV